MTNPTSAILLIDCPDQKGLVATITNFIHQNNGNILHLSQHVDTEQNVFFMRIEWDLNQFLIESSAIGTAFTPIADQFHMNWQLKFSDEVPRMAIFVSKQGHCLYDILSRHQYGEFRVDIPVIISNHPDMKPVAEKFDIPYRQFNVTKANKAEIEQQQIAIVKEFNVDFIVLARYMQILTEAFVTEFPLKIINIHHSFLPAFIGAKPYHRAYARGVKIIGATSHYVTPELDAGPIIEQDVVRVTHKDTVEDMIRKGKDLEKVVLSRAIWNHIENRVLAYNNKTVVFD